MKKKILNLMLLPMSLCMAGAPRGESADGPEDLNGLIDGLDCLIDLHLHFDGSLSMKNARQLAAIEGVRLPESDEELRRLTTVSPEIRDLNEYLEKFAIPLSLLQSEESLSLGMYNLCEELRQDGMLYAEIRFAPQLHCRRGLTQREVLDSVLEGMRRSALDARLILCCMRSGDDNREQNLETVRLAKEYLGKGVCAVDLAGAEALFPNESYRYAMEEAVRLELPMTMHSGEAAGWESVETALDMGARRIGHGVRSVENGDTVARLARERIPLEVCLTSERDTCIFETVDNAPVRKLMEAGVILTVNTDDMAISGIDLRHELKEACRAFSLSRGELQGLLLNAADASFTDDAKKRQLKERINAAFSA